MPLSFSMDVAARRVRLDPKDPAFYSDPYPVYREILAHCPVFYWENYGYWCFARHQDVTALFRDRRFGREVTHLVSRADLGWPEPDPKLEAFHAFEARTMLDREPPIHTRLRGLVNRAFVSRMVERLRPRIEALTHRLIDGFEPQGDVELLSRFAEIIPVTIIAEMLGVPVEYAPQLLDWSHKMVAMYEYGRNATTESQAVAATLAFEAFIRGLLPERRRQPGEDLLSVLLAVEASGDRLTEDELISNAILLLNAGHETTVHAIGNGVGCILALGLDPGELLATPDRVAATVEEILRLHPPLHLFTRFALQRMQLDGIDVAVGERVGLLMGAANRDPAVYSDPDRLDPDRPLMPHVAFGGGIHFCIGAPLARLELALVLPILFRRLPGLRFTEPPTYVDRYHFHGFAALPLRF